MAEEVIGANEDDPMSVEKINIAAELLDRALDLYFRGDSYFSSLHLAGAAEEILGNYVTRLGGEPSFENTRSVAVAIADRSNDGAETITRRKMADTMNLPKNRTKHMNASGDDCVSFDPKEAAKDLLDRAVSDYYQLMSYVSLEETALVKRFNQEIMQRGDQTS